MSNKHHHYLLAELGYQVTANLPPNVQALVVTCIRGDGNG